MSLVLSLAIVFAACAYEPEIRGPGAETGDTSAPPPAPREPRAQNFTTNGCPVDDAAMCEQAAFLANALVLPDADAVFDLSRRVSMDCADLSTATCSPSARTRARSRATWSATIRVTSS